MYKIFLTSIILAVSVEGQFIENEVNYNGTTNITTFEIQLSNERLEDFMSETTRNMQFLKNSVQVLLNGSIQNYTCQCENNSTTPLTTRFTRDEKGDSEVEELRIQLSIYIIRNSRMSEAVKSIPKDSQ